MYTCLRVRLKPVQKVVVSHCPTEDESFLQHLGPNHASIRQPLAAAFADTNTVSYIAVVYIRILLGLLLQPLIEQKRNG